MKPTEEDSYEGQKAKAEFYEEQFNELWKAHSRAMAKAELCFGLLWMMSYSFHDESKKYWAARQALKDAFLHADVFTGTVDGEQEHVGRGIKAAIDAGFEADHPPGSSWWCGKKGNDENE